MTIHPMNSEHYDALVGLWGSYTGNAMTGADSREGFTLFLGRNSSYCFTACESDSVVGSVMAGEDGRRGYIYHLAVARERHHSGIGSALMKKAETALLEAGIEKVHLFIFGDNPAIEFYKKTGWHLRSDIEVMSKVLDGEKYMGTRKF